MQHEAPGRKFRAAHACIETRKSSDQYTPELRRNVQAQLRVRKGKGSKGRRQRDGAGGMAEQVKALCPSLMTGGDPWGSVVKGEKGLLEVVL